MSEEEKNNQETISPEEKTEINTEASVESSTEKEAEASTKATYEETVTKTEVPTKFKKIVEEIENMSVLDLNELVKVFEQKFGVSAAAVVAAGSSNSDAGGGDDDGSLLSVVLEDAGATKIQVIKVVKDILELGLKEAKDFVDGAPKTLKEGLLKEEAETIKDQLETAGARVSLK